MERLREKEKKSYYREGIEIYIIGFCYTDYCERTN